jgi:hypothetical protein
MKVCRLYVAKPILIFYLLMAAAWPLVGVGGIALAMSGACGPGTEGICVTVFVIVLGIGIFVSYSWLRFPFEIRMNEGIIEFRSVVRKTVVPAAEIKSMRAKPYALGFVDVRHARGTVHLVSQMDGFHDFVLTVKSLNPAAKIVGC